MRNSKSSSTDEEGQGKLYCPAYAIKVETGQQKQQHPPDKIKEKLAGHDEAEEGNECKERGQRKVKKGAQKDEQGRKGKHDHQKQGRHQDREDSSIPSSKL